MSISKGVDVNAGSSLDGTTALIDAAENNPNPDVITTLLKAGADGKARDNGGSTAFDYAKNNKKLQGTNAYQLLQKAPQ